MGGSRATDKFEAWRRERERERDAWRREQDDLIARNRDDSYSESYEDTDPIMESIGTDPIMESRYSDWNGWRQEQGMLCRTDDDCWLDSNLACARNGMDGVDHKWFGGDWQRVIGQCECSVGQWDNDQLQCQQVSFTLDSATTTTTTTSTTTTTRSPGGGGGFWGS